MKTVKPFVPIVEAARRRGVSRPTIYLMLRKGLLPVDQRGRISRAAFDLLEALYTDDKEARGD